MPIYQTCKHHKIEPDGETIPGAECPICELHKLRDRFELAVVGEVRKRLRDTKAELLDFLSEFVSMRRFYDEHKYD